MEKLLFHTSSAANYIQGALIIKSAATVSGKVNVTFASADIVSADDLAAVADFLGNAAAALNNGKKESAALNVAKQANAEAAAVARSIFGNILATAYAAATNNATLKQVFAPFASYGVFVPVSVLSNYLNVIRRNDDATIYAVSNIGAQKCYDSETGKELGFPVYGVPVYVSSVPLKETALTMNAKTLKAITGTGKTAKFWRNMADGVMMQFAAATIAERVASGESADNLSAIYTGNAESESESAESVSAAV